MAPPLQCPDPPGLSPSSFQGQLRSPTLSVARENPADARVKNETLDWLSPPLPPLFFVFPSEMKWGKRGGGTLLSHPTPREAESLFFFCRRCQSTGGGGGGRAFFCCMGEWKKTGEGRKIKSWEGGGGRRRRRSCFRCSFSRQRPHINYSNAYFPLPLIHGGACVAVAAFDALLKSDYSLPPSFRSAATNYPRRRRFALI